MRVLTAEFMAGHPDLPNLFSREDQNLLGDNWTRSSTGWNVTQNAVGLNGKPNTAFTLEKTSTSGFPQASSIDRFIGDGEIVTGRVYLKKQAVSPGAQWGFRMVADGTDLPIYLRGNWHNNTIVTAGVATYYGGECNYREIAGETWLEVTMWFLNDANYDRARLRLYPNVTDQTQPLSGVFTHPCLYRSTGFGPASESPWTLPQSEIQGTPPDHGLIAVSSAEIPGLPQPDQDGEVLEAIAGTKYEPRIKMDSNLEYSIGWPVWAQKRGQRSFGGFTLSNHDGQYDYLREYDIRDTIVKIRTWNTESSRFLPDLTLLSTANDDSEPASTVYIGVVENVRFNGDSVRISIADTQHELYSPLGGTFTLESPDIYPQASGEVRPVVIGRPMNVKPVLVDQSTNEYICHVTGLDSISEVYVDGVPQSSVSPTWSYNGDFTGFTLPAEATGAVTCDPASDFTGNLNDVIGNLSVLLGSHFSYDFVSVTDLSDLEYNLQTYQYGFYIKEQTAAWVLDGVCQSLGAFWFVNSQGQVTLRRVKDPSAENYLQNWMLNADYTARMDQWPDIGNRTGVYAYVHSGRKALDGSYSAYYVHDNNNAATESIRTGNPDGTFRVLPCPTSHNTLVARLFFRQNDTHTDWRELRIFDDPTDSGECRIAFQPSSGSVSDLSTASGSSLSVNQWRDADGHRWYEAVIQIDTTSGQSYEVRLYPIGVTASSTGGTDFMDLEVYFDVTKEDVLGSPIASKHERWVRYNDILSEVQSVRDHSPGLSTKMSAKKNWTVSSANASNSSDTDRLSKPAQLTVETTQILAVEHQEALTRPPIMSMFTGDEAEGIAQTCIDDICSLYTKSRRFVTVEVPADKYRIASLVDDMGTVWRLELTKADAAYTYGLLCGVSYDANREVIKLRFWE